MEIVGIRVSPNRKDIHPYHQPVLLVFKIRLDVLVVDARMNVPVVVDMIVHLYVVVVLAVVLQHQQLDVELQTAVVHARQHVVFNVRMVVHRAIHLVAKGARDAVVHAALLVGLAVIIAVLQHLRLYPTTVLVLIIHVRTIVLSHVVKRVMQIIRLHVKLVVVYAKVLYQQLHVLQLVQLIPVQMVLHPM